MINNIVDVEQNEINREKFNFEFFEIDMKIEFATKTTFDLMIDSKFNIVDVELKLIVNFSNLNDSEKLRDMIFEFCLRAAIVFSIFF